MRPQKNSADYFRHYCKPGSGRTKRLLFRQFGHTGKSCWFELLELLADAENHFLDVSEEVAWLDLLDVLSINEETGKAFFEFLVRIKKIDQRLWEDRKIIWCQKLTDNLEPLYSKRGRKPPEKPLTGNINTLESSFCNKNAVSGPETPYSTEQKSRAKKSKVKDSTAEPNFAAESEENLTESADLSFEKILSKLSFTLLNHDASQHPDAIRQCRLKAEKLCKKYAADHIKRKIEYFEFMVNYQKEKMKSPTGYLIASIENENWPPPTGYEEYRERQKLRARTELN